MGKLDIYIIKKFLSTYVFSFLVVISIAIVIDISEKLEDFMECTASTWTIISEYYLTFIPYMGGILTPLLIFIAVILFTSRLAYNSEIIAMLSSGISYWRFLRPYLITGLFLAIMMFYANHYLVPDANKTRIGFELVHIKSQKWYGDNIHMRLDPETFVSLGRFKYQKNEGVNFALEKYELDGEIKELSYKLIARKIFWQPEQEKWRITDYSKWSIDGLRESYQEGRQFDTVLNMRPDDFEVDVFLKESMDRNEMREFLRSESEQGSSGLEFYRVEHHRRTAAAISIFILTIIGAAIGSRKIRGGTGLHLAAGIGLSALYMVFLQFSSTFSTNADLDPAIGTNIPNVLFGIMAMVLVRYTPK